MILQSTKKLQEFVGVKPTEIEIDTLSSWHGNIFNIGRRKCLLITHTATLYSAFFYGVTKKDLPLFLEMMRDRVMELMRQDNFTLQELSIMREGFIDINYTKTSSRSVLGSMNDMKNMLDWYDMSEDEISLAKRINKTPYKIGGYIYPKEALRALLKEKIQQKVKNDK
ncbi:hypothetical protein LCX93_11630 [Sulfurimonas sp. SWIR-19]|uniref:DUF6933 domain-containing protein n=1 Tax=Sulfurimonas sp. SWIR-19 TaxID=2878390 RepID=UPI001CF2A635|nr:hypothetical protein [Sulfurimonas sp. SWIR-19]UCN00159.1 hypothetical protein LCX93_11630 [Sulfurimonas sp. SWIR-19]